MGFDAAVQLPRGCRSFPGAAFSTSQGPDRGTSVPFHRQTRMSVLLRVADTWDWRAPDTRPCWDWRASIADILVHIASKHFSCWAKLCVRSRITVSSVGASGIPRSAILTSEPNASGRAAELRGSQPPKISQAGFVSARVAMVRMTSTPSSCCRPCLQLSLALDSPSGVAFVMRCSPSRFQLFSPWLKE